MYKKIIAVIAVIAAALALTACGKTSNSVKLAEAPAGAGTEAGGDAAADNTDKDNGEVKAAEADDKGTADGKTEDTQKKTEEDKDKEPLTVEGIVAPAKMLDQEWTGTIAADGDGLRLRSGPDPEYEEIDLIPDETQVTVYAEENGWGYTNYRDQYGWISLEWVAK